MKILKHLKSNTQISGLVLNLLSSLQKKKKTVYKVLFLKADILWRLVATKTGISSSIGKQ